MCSCIQTGKAFQGGGLMDSCRDAAIGLRRAQKNKEMRTKKHCVFYRCSVRKKLFIVRDYSKYWYVRVLLIDGGAEKNSATVQERTNNHIFQLQRQSRGP